MKRLEDIDEENEVVIVCREKGNASMKLTPMHEETCCQCGCTVAYCQSTIDNAERVAAGKKRFFACGNCAAPFFEEQTDEDIDEDIDLHSRVSDAQVIEIARELGIPEDKIALAALKARLLHMLTQRKFMAKNLREPRPDMN